MAADRSGHVPRKRFGQHFLRDANIIGKMVSAIAPKAGGAVCGQFSLAIAKLIRVPLAGSVILLFIATAVPNMPHFSAEKRGKDGEVPARASLAERVEFWYNFHLGKRPVFRGLSSIFSSREREISAPHIGPE